MTGLRTMKCLESTLGPTGMHKTSDPSISFEITRAEWYTSQNYCITFENLGLEVAGIFVPEPAWSQGPCPRYTSSIGSLSTLYQAIPIIWRCYLELSLVHRT